MRLTYIHAYQSFLWNTVVSKRLAKFGLQPIVGDLVYAPDETGEEEAEPELEEEVPEDESAEGSETGSVDGSTSSKRAQRNQRKVMFVDEKNIGNYTIFDVILPLPGYDIVYPANEAGQWYLELLTADGMAESSFKQSVKFVYDASSSFHYYFLLFAASLQRGSFFPL